VTIEEPVRKTRRSNPNTAARREASLAVKGLSGEISRWNARRAFLLEIAVARRSSPQELQVVLAELAQLHSEVELCRVDFLRTFEGNRSSPIQDVAAALERLTQRFR
jgi:hypothetical protein